MPERSDREVLFIAASTLLAALSIVLLLILAVVP